MDKATPTALPANRLRAQPFCLRGLPEGKTLGPRRGAGYPPIRNTSAHTKSAIANSPSHSKRRKAPNNIQSTPRRNPRHIATIHLHKARQGCRRLLGASGRSPVEGDLPTSPLSLDVPQFEDHPCILIPPAGLGPAGLSLSRVRKRPEGASPSLGSPS